MTRSLVWLRNEVSRWLMRVQQGSQPLKILMWGAITINTFVTAWAKYLPTWATAAGILSLVAGSIIFVWAYDRFQVLNIQNRWNDDRSSNYVGPSMAIDRLVTARQLAAAVDGVMQEKSEEEIRKDIHGETLELLRRYRDGIDLEELGYEV